jgi:cardiolipin synthase A/B
MTASPKGVPRDRVVTSPTERQRAVLDVIAGAKSHIALSLYRCNDKEIFRELALALTRGVAVEALVTSRSKGKKKLRKLWAQLQRIGVTVHPYLDPVIKYHAKYLIADDGPAVISSLNFTRKCFTRTVDALVVTYDDQIVSSLKRLMTADSQGEPLPSDMSPRLIIGPEHARSQITTLVTQARSSILLLDPKLSDPTLSSILDARRGDGVSMGLFTADRFGDLRAHGKMMLVDNTLAMVGSIALTSMSLEFRREVAVTFDDPAAIAEIGKLFATLGPPSASPGPLLQDGASC